MEKKLFRRIPKVDVLLETKQCKAMIDQHGYQIVIESIREELEQIRAQILNGTSEEELFLQIDHILYSIENRVKEKEQFHIRKVFNGTGTILHTNLGRAPLSVTHMEKIAEIASGYSNLEFELEKGERGERYSHFETLLCKITGAQAAMAVNNNAAAVMLVLNTMAKGGEAIVSRGELVEVGGKFRIPDVMEQSGTILREVGTTNKTHLFDYENAITEETKVLMKVHTSNYRIFGFTNSVSVKELGSLKEKYELPIIEDLGSGVLLDLEKYGLAHEPTVQESIQNGADIVCFSGDKLLGGPQAGIIVGKKKYIDQMKKNQLTRALRIDKFTACALEAVLKEYMYEENAIKNIPVLEMITRPLEQVQEAAEELFHRLTREEFPAVICTQKCMSQIGGGSLPMEQIESMAVSIQPHFISTELFAKRLRTLPIPVIGRVTDEKFLLDMRTFDKTAISYFVEILKKDQIFKVDR